MQELRRLWSASDEPVNGVSKREHAHAIPQDKAPGPPTRDGDARTMWQAKASVPSKAAGAQHGAVGIMHAHCRSPCTLPRCNLEGRAPCVEEARQRESVRAGGCRGCAHGAHGHSCRMRRTARYESQLGLQPLCARRRPSVLEPLRMSSHGRRTCGEAGASGSAAHHPSSASRMLMPPIL